MEEFTEDQSNMANGGGGRGLNFVNVAIWVSTVRTHSSVLSTV